jgi:hypothetical protein
MCRVTIQWMGLAVSISTGDRPPPWISIRCRPPKLETAYTHPILCLILTAIKVRDIKIQNLTLNKVRKTHIYLYRIQLFPPVLSQIVPKKPGIGPADETGADELRKREGLYAEEVAGDTGESPGNVIGAH